MPNFGTYEGHRILTDGMNRTMERAAKRYEFDKAQKLEHAKARQQKERDIEKARQFDEQMAENQRQFNVGDERAQFTFDQAKKGVADEELKKEAAKYMLGQATSNDYTMIDPKTGGLIPENVKSLLSKGLDNTYIQDVLAKFPGLSADEAEKIAGDAHRRGGQRLQDEMVGRFTKAGWDQDDIQSNIEAAGLTPYMDDYYRRSLGINPDSDSFTPTNTIQEALYNQYKKPEVGPEKLSSIRYDNKSTSKTEENQLMKALGKFKDYSKFQSSAIFDDVDDVQISQNSKGEWTLREEDAVFDDEYKIEFDDKGPYVTAGLFQGPGGKGSKIYLNNTETFEDLEDLLE